MASKLSPLLCELHAHTTWSDGRCRLPSSSISTAAPASTFSPSPTTRCRGGTSQEDNFAAYRAEIAGRGRAGAAALRPARHSGARADLRRPRPAQAGHAVAIGLRLRRRRRRPRGCFARRARARGGARRRPPVSARRTRGRSNAGDGGVRDGSRAVGAARRPLRALQPRDALRVGRRRRPAGGRAAATSTSASTSASWKTLLPCAKDEEASSISPVAAAGVPRAPPSQAEPLLRAA